VLDALESETSLESSQSSSNRLDEALQFAERKQKKAQLESGISLFNKKPLKGIKYLIENGFLEDSDDAIAKFLLSDDRLDRAAIGEYLGEGDKRCITIMHRYVDFTDFSASIGFLASLRHFLVRRATDRLQEWHARSREPHPNAGGPGCGRAISGCRGRRKRSIASWKSLHRATTR
jgi:anti-sigma28 factor (negative regulator of flagellin synthesis)